ALAARFTLRRSPLLRKRWHGAADRHRELPERDIPVRSRNPWRGRIFLDDRHALARWHRCHSTHEWKRGTAAGQQDADRRPLRQGRGLVASDVQSLTEHAAQLIHERGHFRLGEKLAQISLQGTDQLLVAKELFLVAARLALERRDPSNVRRQSGVQAVLLDQI